MDGGTPNLTLVWLAQGRIRLKQGNAGPRTIESRFAQGIRERAVKAQQRHGWKQHAAGENFLSGAMLWGRQIRDPAAIPISITSLCRGSAPGQVLYSLETNDLCGILQLEDFGAEERRLWNKNDQRLDHLHVSTRGEMACGVRHPFGTANVAVRLSADSGLSEVTEGDSVDTAPRWIPGESRRLVYQTAGVGRDRHGQFATLGPYSIQTLDIDSGELVTLLENPAHDLLMPQVTADGTLYFIRRPHLTGREISPLRLLKDVFLFPFRLLIAVFHYLQFFAMRYTGKKLSSGGAQSKELDLQQMMIWGNMVSAQNAQQPGEEAPDLVPRSWELVRRTPDGQEEVLAKGVLAYDLVEDGSLVYSNGSAIFLRRPDGQRERLVVERLIERVVWLDSATPPRTSAAD